MKVQGSPSDSPRIEQLESRTLLALTAGFEQTVVTRVDTFIAPSMTFAPDGRLFVVDNSNRQVRIIKNGVRLPTPALTFAAEEVDRSRERGLQSIAFDPNFAANGYVYLYYTRPDPAAPNTAPSNAANRLVRFRMSGSSPDVIDKSSMVVLLDDVPSPSSVHNGGAMHFGADGMLYLGTGDGGLDSTLAQDLNSLNGKVLRLNVSAVGAAAANPVGMAPTTNPFYNAADGITVRDYVFAYGVRNPFSGAIRPGTNMLFINDVGNAAWEEVNHVQAGKNYGWPLAEGSSANPAFVNPIHTYSHHPNGTSQPRVPTSVTGGVFYSGNDFPTTYLGKYFFADYRRQFIKVIDPATRQVSDFFTEPGGERLLEVLDLDVAPDGTLWTLSQDGTIHRYRYVGSGNRAPIARASANVTSGKTPLAVNFSGAASSDPDGDGLTYTWDFGDGTTGTGRSVTKTYAAAGRFAARLTVRDGRGASAVSQPITIIPGSVAPLGTITAPVVGETYRGGLRINFAGTATDPEDGVLPASAYEWKVVFHHADHFHPHINSIPGVTSGSFVIPRVGEQAPDQWYRIHLTVTDSKGVRHTSFRDIRPRLTTIALATNVPGVGVTLDGSPQDAPGSVQGVEGMLRTLGVAAPVQTVGSKTYRFTGWSDGVAENHDIVFPRDYSTYVANFEQIAGPVDRIVAPRADAYVRNGASANVNFGLDTAMGVKRSANIGNSREAHMAFDLTGIPVGARQRVKLRMWGQISDRVDPALPISVHAVADTGWGERQITWNTRPASRSTALATQTITGTALRMYEWDVTDYVAAENAAGRHAVAFALKPGATSNSIVWFQSGEAAAYGPALVVEPPTTTIATTTAAYVRAGAYAGLNFGNDASLIVRVSSDPSHMRVSYLKFDISAVPGAITSAGLRLFGALDVFSGAGVQIGAYRSPATDWSESGVRFTNRPASDVTPLSTLIVTGTTKRWYEWDVTAFIREAKAAGRNSVTIAVRGTANSDPLVAFNSDDAASNRPRLVVT